MDTEPRGTRPSFNFRFYLELNILFAHACMILKCQADQCLPLAYQATSNQCALQLLARLAHPM